MLFNNEIIDVSSLPTIENVEYTPIEKRYRRIMIINSVILGLFLFTPLAVISLINDDVQLYVGLFSVVGLVGFIGFNFVWSGVSINHKMYKLRSHDILFKTGVIWKKTTAIPFNRIQHVEVKQSAIARQFDLSKIVIFTAGGNAGDLSIAGLNHEDANKIREFIMNELKNYE